MIITGRIVMNICFVIGLSIGIMAWFFHFFIEFNPLWKKTKCNVYIENLHKHSMGFSQRDKFYLLEVLIDDRRCFVIGDKTNYIGESIEVFYSDDMVVVRQYRFTLYKISLLAMAIVFWKKFVFVFQNFFLLYVILLIVAWIVYPLLYKSYYQWIIQGYLNGLGFDEMDLLQKDFWIRDRMNDDSGVMKTFLVVFFATLLIAIIFLMGIAFWT